MKHAEPCVLDRQTDKQTSDRQIYLYRYWYRYRYIDIGIDINLCIDTL